jgi:hypothetical protein
MAADEQGWVLPSAAAAALAAELAAVVLAVDAVELPMPGKLGIRLLMFMRILRNREEERCLGKAKGGPMLLESRRIFLRKQANRLRDFAIRCRHAA